MGEFKGTPGPWMVGGTLRADALAVIGDGDSVVCEFPDRLGASVDADASLIAAAPALLEALRGCLEVMGRSFGNGKPVPINCAEAVAAFAAIRQATEGDKA